MIPMQAFCRATLCLLGLGASLHGGTVVITSLPDDEHPAPPLNSLAGVPLPLGSEIRVGAFPGMDGDALLDAAATGGFAQISSAFAAFGEAQAIGEGADGNPGTFEISVRQDTPDGASPLVGETVSLLIKAADSDEFLVARFPGIVFEADDATGLEPLQSLHFGDARIVIGNRFGDTQVSTSSAPSVGSFATWILGFPAITDPTDREPGADPDRDGRTNFLEYATGGDPGSGSDAAPFLIERDDAHLLWVKFPREPGLGAIRFTVESSAALTAPWQALGGSPEPDPDPPVAGSLIWQRMPVPPSPEPAGFFRLSVGSP